MSADQNSVDYLQVLEWCLGVNIALLFEMTSVELMKGTHSTSQTVCF